MAERVLFIVVVLILKFTGETFAQQKNVEKLSPLTEKWERYTASSHLFKVKETAPKSGENHSSRSPTEQPVSTLAFPISIANPYSIPSSGNYVQNLPFFCRAEYRFEKATSIPFRFRLGSIDYTDYLERKPNAKAPGR